jgi:hypothetical protein
MRENSFGFEVARLQRRCSGPVYFERS